VPRVREDVAGCGIRCRCPFHAGAMCHSLPVPLALRCSMRWARERASGGSGLIAIEYHAPASPLSTTDPFDLERFVTAQAPVNNRCPEPTASRAPTTLSGCYPQCSFDLRQQTMPSSSHTIMTLSSGPSICQMRRGDSHIAALKDARIMPRIKSERKAPSHRCPTVSLNRRRAPKPALMTAIVVAKLTAPKKTIAISDHG
jgi:hypothetical protein